MTESQKIKLKSSSYNFDEDIWTNRKKKLRKIVNDKSISKENRLKAVNLMEKCSNITAWYCYGICLGQYNWMRDKIE